MFRRSGQLGRGIAAGWLSAAAALVLLGSSGCSTGERMPVRLDERVDPAVWSSFAPVSMRISSLTRVEEGPSGLPRLVLYFELLDAWGDSTKTPGWLQVELFAVRGVSGEREQRWEVDLTDPGRNSAFFDITRMYRMPLDEAPAWLIDEAAGNRPTAVRIRGFYRTMGPAQTVIDLRDSFERSL